MLSYKYDLMYFSFTSYHGTMLPRLRKQVKRQLLYSRNALDCITKHLPIVFSSAIAETTCTADLKFSNYERI